MLTICYQIFDLLELLDLAARIRLAHPFEDRVPHQQRVTELDPKAGDCAHA